MACSLCQSQLPQRPTKTACCCFSKNLHPRPESIRPIIDLLLLLSVQGRPAADKLYAPLLRAYDFHYMSLQMSCTASLISSSFRCRSAAAAAFTSEGM